MTDLSDFEISRKWPAKHADRIQLYSLRDAQRHQGFGDAGRNGPAL